MHAVNFRQSSFAAHAVPSPCHFSAFRRLRTRLRNEVVTLPRSYTAWTHGINVVPSAQGRPAENHACSGYGARTIDVTRIVSGSPVSIPSTFTRFKLQSKRLAGAGNTLLSNASLQSLPLASRRVAACLARPVSPGGSPIATARMPESMTRPVTDGTATVRLTSGVLGLGVGEAAAAVSDGSGDAVAVRRAGGSGVAVLVGAVVAASGGDAPATAVSAREAASWSLSDPHAKTRAMRRTSTETLMEIILQTRFLAYAQRR